jgi:hypothetical protein
MSISWISGVASPNSFRIRSRNPWNRRWEKWTSPSPDESEPAETACDEVLRGDAAHGEVVVEDRVGGSLRRAVREIDYDARAGPQLRAEIRCVEHNDGAGGRGFRTGLAPVVDLDLKRGVLCPETVDPLQDASGQREAERGGTR